MSEGTDLVLRIADGAIITTVGEHIVVRAGAGVDNTYVFTDPKLVTLLLSFRTPRTSGDAAAACDVEPQVARTAVAHFRAVGAIQPANGERTVDEANQSELQMLGEIANAAYLLAGDCVVLDRHRQGMAKSLYAQVSAGVTVANAVLKDAVATVDRARERLVDEQRGDLATGGDRCRRVNIGAGQSSIESWLNIDLASNDVATNVRWGLPLATESATHVYACHVLEHLYYPQEAGALITEVYRVLMKGAQARFVVPDIERCIRAYVEGDDSFFRERSKTWPWASAHQTKLGHFLNYAGAAAEPAHFFGHKYGYDFETLKHLLMAARFTDVTRSGFMESADPVFRIDDRSTNASARYAGGHYSLFVEARAA